MFLASSLHEHRGSCAGSALLSAGEQAIASSLDLTSPAPVLPFLHLRPLANPMPNASMMNAACTCTPLRPVTTTCYQAALKLDKLEQWKWEWEVRRERGAGVGVGCEGRSEPPRASRAHAPCVLVSFVCVCVSGVGVWAWALGAWAAVRIWKFRGTKSNYLLLENVCSHSFFVPAKSARSQSTRLF